MVRDLLQFNTIYKKVIVSLSVVVAGVFVVYAVLHVQVLSRGVTQKVLQQYVAETASSVSSLEHDYMRRMNLLTLDEARVRGFVDAEVSLFVSQHTPTLTLHDGAY